MFHRPVRIFFLMLCSLCFPLSPSAHETTNNTIIRRVSLLYDQCSEEQRQILHSIVNLEMVGMLTVASRALRITQANTLGSYSYAKYADYFGQRYVNQRRRRLRRRFTDLLDRRSIALVPRTMFSCGGQELLWACDEGQEDPAAHRHEIGFVLPDPGALGDLLPINVIGLCPQFWRLRRWTIQLGADDQVSSIVHLFLKLASLRDANEIHHFHIWDNNFAAEDVDNISQQTMFAKSLVLRQPEHGRYQFRWDRNRHLQVVYQRRWLPPHSKRNGPYRAGK